MLYTQEVTIGDSGILRIGTIGGSPDMATPKGNRAQVGYQIPPRVGLVRWDEIDDEDAVAVLEVIADVTGYGGRPITGMRGPGKCFVELPCSITLKGNPGTRLIIEAWEIEGINGERGGSQSFYAPQTITVPLWATSFDLAGGVATFRDAASAVVGIVDSTTTTTTGFSVPDRTRTVELTGDDVTFVLRQEG